MEFNRENYPEHEIAHLADCAEFKNFQEKINTVGFFSDKQLFIFENFFKGKAPKWKTEIDFARLESQENIFVFWEEGSLNIAGKKAVAATTRPHVFEFKIPNLLWEFLDSISPNNVGVRSQDEPLQILRQILKKVDANYLFLMLVRQFRLLILTNGKYKDYPSDYKRLTFQKYKLAKQASFFKEEYLHDLYIKLLDIEARQKTGNGIYDLQTEIEKFLLSL